MTLSGHTVKFIFLLLQYSSTQYEFQTIDYVNLVTGLRICVEIIYFRLRITKLYRWIMQPKRCNRQCRQLRIHRHNYVITVGSSAKYCLSQYFKPLTRNGALDGSSHLNLMEVDKCIRWTFRFPWLHFRVSIHGNFLPLFCMNLDTNAFLTANTLFTSFSIPHIPFIPHNIAQIFTSYPFHHHSSPSNYKVVLFLKHLVRHIRTADRKTR